MKDLSKWLPFRRDESKMPVDRPTAAGPLPTSMAEMRREMDRIFDRFMPAPFGAWSDLGMDHWFGDFSAARFAPMVDITDENENLRVTVELPGMDEKDVKVLLHEDRMIVRGEKKAEETKEGEGFYRAERSFGAFERTIPLPTDVAHDKATAAFKKGVLTIRLPKTANAKPARQIPISTD